MDFVIASENYDERDEFFTGVWSHEKANELQIKQITNSGCGATGIMTALRLLLPNKNFAPNEILENSVLRKRENSSSLPKYLASRSIAGCTGEEIAEAIQKFDSKIYSNFFKCLKVNMNTDGDNIALLPTELSLPNIDKAFTIENTTDLISWIAKRISNRDGMIATLNLQLLGNDAWHHQFIYGVDTKKKLIYCTNPISVYKEHEFKMFLCTPSILVIKKEDILSRYHLPGGQDTKFYEENLLWNSSGLHVAKQIDQCIRGEKNHIIIPASYSGGISVFNIHT